MKWAISTSRSSMGGTMNKVGWRIRCLGSSDSRALARGTRLRRSRLQPGVTGGGLGSCLRLARFNRQPFERRVVAETLRQQVDGIERVHAPLRSDVGTYEVGNLRATTANPTRVLVRPAALAAGSCDGRRQLQARHRE